jgi:FkbM family methyltransferase
VLEDAGSANGGAVKVLEPQRESIRVQLARRTLQNWPLPRGKGILFRLFQPAFSGTFVFQYGDMLVPGRFDDWMIMASFMHGPEETFVFSWSLIRRGDIVVDVGANTGLWCINAAKRAGAAGAVHAFEPLASNLERLQASSELNHTDCLTAHGYAASDVAGEVTFYEPASANSGVGRLAPGAGLTAGKTVPTVVLNDFLRRRKVQVVDFIKVDVEGAEARVLQGASYFLQQSPGPIVMFEMNNELAGAFGSSMLEMERFLRQFGYRIFQLHRGHLSEVETRGYDQHADLFALKPPHLERAEIKRMV